MNELMFLMFQKFEIGTFYVYRNKFGDNEGEFELRAVAETTNDNDLQIPTGNIWRLKSQVVSNGARLGSSIISLGRLDGDQYEDFAVGAPYDDNGIGAIYIYRGSKYFWASDGIYGKLGIRTPLTKLKREIATY